MRDVQIDTLSRKLAHVDFYRVSMSERLRAEVSLDLFGEAPAVHHNEGILLHGIPAVEVHCLPADLPESIRVDLSQLKAVDDAIYVRDLVMPAGVDLLTDGELLVVRVAPLAREEVEDLAGEMAATAEVETVREVKARDKAAEEGEAPKK